jgi:hypothetical protein
MRLVLAFVASLVAACAAVPLTSDFTVNVSKGLRLLTFEDGTEAWKTEAEKLDIMRAHTPFVSQNYAAN